MQNYLPKQAIILTILLGLILICSGISYLCIPNLQTTTEETSIINPTYPININTATATELMMLPGIGEQKAAAIIEYRRLHGKFSSLDQLININGIGEKSLKDIEDFIYAE